MKVFGVVTQYHFTRQPPPSQHLQTNTTELPGPCSSQVTTTMTMAKTLLSAALLIGGTCTTALPLLVNESMVCSTGVCTDPHLKYQRKAATPPGYQWDDAGGYCGSWASQRAMLAKGAWVSQQQVRDHTKNCGGHDSEILSCNIDEALTNLKVDYNAFDYVNTPLPQTTAYAAWLKEQLVSAPHHTGPRPTTHAPVAPVGLLDRMVGCFFFRVVLIVSERLSLSPSLSLCPPLP